MDYEFMTTRLAAWLAPETIVAAAAELAREPGKALQPSSLVLCSPVLKPGQDGRFRHLCEEFLRRFQIPHDVIAFLRNTVGEENDNYNWAELEQLRFEGVIRAPAEDIDIPDAHLLVAERSVVIDVLAQPLKALQGMVAQSLETWLKASAGGLSADNVYHKHNGSEPFQVWLDVQVGQASGFANLGKKVEGLTGPNSRYRAVTVSNFRTGSGRLLAVIQECAKDQAASTWGPV
jgi:hypothetical protein